MPEDTPEGKPAPQAGNSAAGAEKNEARETEPRISIEDFARVQMRVGQILEAEKVEGSRKLLKLKVDIGSEVRQVVAGISEAYAPEDLLNRKIVLVANLKPARLMGIESNGMIVAASDEGRPVLATFREDVPNGSLLR
jgi:methionyl-tRNA synthetase